MQCFLIFDHLNDVVYVKSDANFDTYIHKKLKEEGLLEDGDAAGHFESHDFSNALIQYFSPLLASQRIMICQFNNPYSAMHCEDGTILVFAEYVGFLLLMIGRGDGVTETLLRRKIEIYLRLSTLLCGPTLEILKATYGGKNHVRREMLGDLIDVWCSLHNQEMSFLLEAEEQLITNADLSSMWVKLLQNVLEKVRSGTQEWTACHAFLLVNTKILALYSRNACMLSESDTLLLIILACARQADLAPHLEASRRERLLLPACLHPQESMQSSDSEQFYSPCGSPPHLSEGDLCAGISKMNVLEANVMVAGSETECQKGEGELFAAGNADGFVDIAAEFSCDLVFLQASFSSLAPHLVHTVHVTPGIILVVVSMVNRHVLSGSLIRGIETLHEIQAKLSSVPAKSTLDGLEAMMRTVVESLKKQKISSTEIELSVKRLQSSWSSVKKNGLLKFLKSRDLKSLSPRLESDIGKLIYMLKEFFRKYCISWYRNDLFMATTNGPFIDAQALVRYTLADYVEYLQVKAKQNVSMTPYYSEFPGLVHFVYVDRVKNQIMLPTIGADSSAPADAKETPEIVTGDIVWKKLYAMVHTAWKYLQSGCTTLLWRDGCFHYSYFIWFEDAMGNLFNPEVKNISKEDLPLPGIISKNFYRELIKVCFPSSPDYIRCYELFCVHLSTVPATMVHQHARRLTAKVWEISGAAQSPVDLL